MRAFGWQLAPIAIANRKHFVELGGCGVGFAFEFEFDFVFEIIGRELAWGLDALHPNFFVCERMRRSFSDIFVDIRLGTFDFSDTPVLGVVFISKK